MLSSGSGLAPGVSGSTAGNLHALGLPPEQVCVEVSVGVPGLAARWPLGVQLCLSRKAVSAGLVLAQGLWFPAPIQNLLPLEGCGPSRQVEGSGWNLGPWQASRESM